MCIRDSSYTYRNLLFRNTIEFTRNWSKNSPYGSFAEYTSLNPYWAPYDDEGNLNRVFLVHSGKDDNTSYSDIAVSYTHLDVYKRQMYQ